MSLFMRTRLTIAGMTHLILAHINFVLPFTATHAIGHDHLRRAEQIGQQLGIEVR